MATKQQFKPYIFTQSFKSPYVTATGMPHKPTKIQMKKFQKGEVIKGELKVVNGKPAFILAFGTIVVPLSVVREVITKEVVTGTDGSTVKDTGSKPSTTLAIKPAATNRIKYLDAAIVGAVLGFSGVYLAEKKGWIAQPDKKYKIYGAIGGALAAAYIVFRFKKK